MFQASWHIRECWVKKVAARDVQAYFAIEEGSSGATRSVRKKLHDMNELRVCCLKARILL
jgi:hypothetical protein